MIKIAPSVLSADFTQLGEQVRLVEKAGAEYLHLDIMDGHFVPNITFGPMVVAAVKKSCKMFFDVHLMIENPDLYIDSFIQAGADLVTVHAETSPHLHRTIQAILSRGIKAGVAVNPATGPEMIRYVLGMVDLVLVMTVNPGFGGQNFLPEMVPKIRLVREMLAAAGSSAEIQVDGGITVKTAPVAAEAGATVLVAGSAVFDAPDPGAAVQAIRKASGG